jgi:hypothetical protein
MPAGLPDGAAVLPDTYHGVTADQGKTDILEPHTSAGKLPPEAVDLWMRR